MVLLGFTRIKISSITCFNLSGLKLRSKVTLILAEYKKPAIQVMIAIKIGSISNGTELLKQLEMLDGEGGVTPKALPNRTPNVTQI